MDKKELYNVGLDLIYLAACALDGRLPEKEKLAVMDLKSIYKMAKRHSMQGIVYFSIEKCREKYGDDIIDEELFNKWKSSYHLVVNRLVRFDLEREALCAFLEEKGVWYLCLKGVVLQNYYPALGMRQMTDNDILVDPTACKMIREYMIGRGYTVYSYGTHCHDTYCKGNITFEIHRKLYEDDKKTKSGWKYYRNVKNMLKNGEKPFEMRFADDDFYVYYAFHAYKHYAISGCGIRTLMDMYVYLSAKGDTLDLDKINRELSVLGIRNYENSSRELAFKLFSFDKYGEENLTDEQKEMLEYYILSGTFGTSKQRIENSVSDISGGEAVTASVKLRYIIKRIFPDMEYYRNNHPKASKFIVTIPILWLIRIFRGLKKGKTVAGEVKHLNKMK